jgi:hypothetical protein
VAAVTTAVLAVILVFLWGSPGAAAALLTGGLVNTVFAWKAMTRCAGAPNVVRSVTPVVVTAALSLALGLGVSLVTGPLLSAVAGCLVFTAVALRQDNDLVRMGLARLNG